MPDGTPTKESGEDLRCPECHAVLKHRRSRTPDACEMVCGGCGQQFDVCDIDTIDRLKSAQT